MVTGEWGPHGWKRLEYSGNLQPTLTRRGGHVLCEGKPHSLTETLVVEDAKGKSEDHLRLKERQNEKQQVPYIQKP